MKNADRFLGFADLYNKARPRVPLYPIRLLCTYLGHRPGLVVDLGCGTGLSTQAWQGNCEKALGVDPNPDMLDIARQKATGDLSFQTGSGENTGLPDSCADIVVCSQSFHWMEPHATLREINRVLRPDGIFATIDCDWPAVTNWRAEKAYMDVYKKVQSLETTLPNIRDSFIRYPKSEHLKNMSQSGYFAYTREIVFTSQESCTKERFRQMLFSQGGVQAVVREYPECIRDDLKKFEHTIDQIWSDETFEIEFCYRMRAGIKSSV